MRTKKYETILNVLAGIGLVVVVWLLGYSEWLLV